MHAVNRVVFFQGFLFWYNSTAAHNRQHRGHVGICTATFSEEQDTITDTILFDAGQSWLRD